VLLTGNLRRWQGLPAVWRRDVIVEESLDLQNGGSCRHSELRSKRREVLLSRGIRTVLPVNSAVEAMKKDRG
jgi:hypothetical protein